MASVASDDAELARQLEDVREQQRAISGVLRAVARSAGIQPVLDEVVEACERLCRADYSALYLLEQGLLHVAAHNNLADGAEYDRQHPHALDRTTGAGRAAVAREPVHIPDIREDPEYSYGGPTYYRSLVAVPILVEDNLIGVVVASGANRCRSPPNTSTRPDLRRPGRDRGRERALDGGGRAAADGARSLRLSAGCRADLEQ